jgi:hypothetical protein
MMMETMENVPSSDRLYQKRTSKVAFMKECFYINVL